MPRPLMEELLPQDVNGLRFLSTLQACRILHVSRTTIYQLIRRKKDPLPSVLVGGLRRFPLDKIRWWMENLGR